MDRFEPLNREDHGEVNQAGAADFLLPSRAAALATLRSALTESAGPLLLTGETGTGKTWLCRRLLDSLPHGWSGLTVDVSPWFGPAALERAVLAALGVSSPTTTDPGSASAELREVLHEGRLEGRHWVLVVDEAQNGSDELFESIRLLGNRLGQPDGLAGIVISGQTSLLRRFERRPLSNLAARMSARVHLRALDVDELYETLERLDPDPRRDMAAVEHFYRVARGIPRLVFQQRRTAREVPNRHLAPAILPATGPASEPAVEAFREARPPLDLTAAVPARPPLQVSEGVVEVGWDAGAMTSHDEPGKPELSITRPITMESSDSEADVMEPASSPPALGEEVVTDRYAAIQAWQEWSGNHADAEAAPDAEADEVDAPTTSPSAYSDVRPESQHGFAPYSQLFSRLRTAPDAS